jgi:hypothetical protein
MASPERAQRIAILFLIVLVLVLAGVAIARHV